MRIGGGGNAGQASISGDGSTIFGTTFDDNGIGQAAKWLGGTQWQLLGSVEGGVSCDISLSSGWDVSYDGRLGVGLAWLPKQCSAHAASWDLVDGGPAADLGSLVPNRSTRANTISGDGHVSAPGGEDPRANWRVVSSGFFAALGVPIIAGRDFNDLDGKTEETRVIVSETLARRMFPDQDAINRFFMAREGLIPREAFFNPENMQRLMGAQPQTRPLLRTG